MRAGWFVVGVVSLLTALAVTVGPTMVGISSPRRVHRSAQPPLTAPPTRGNQTTVSADSLDQPTIVRLQSAETTPFGASAADLASRDDSLAPDSLAPSTDFGTAPGFAEAPARASYPTLADRTPRSNGNRLLRALFPLGATMLAPRRTPELPPPDVSMPAGLEPVVR